MTQTAEILGSDFVKQSFEDLGVVETTPGAQVGRATCQYS